MSLDQSLQQINLRERRLHIVRSHLEAFDVERVFPIPIFEEAILEIEGTCGVDSSCKVEGNQLWAGRFEVCNYIGVTWPECLNPTVKFLDKLENYLGIKIKRQAFEQFCATHFNSRKIINNSIGIRVDPNLKKSSVSLYFHLDHDQDPEELVRTAMTLDQRFYPEELTQILIRETILIGFELFFDGRSIIEISPGAPAIFGDLGQRGSYLTPYIEKHFSEKVNSLFRKSHLIWLSYSGASTEPVLWFFFPAASVKNISTLFSFNDLGDRIYSFVKNQDCVVDATVVVTEKELEKSRLENFCLFYTRRDSYQPYPEYKEMMARRTPHQG
ncbi:LynF/TruF/PatF family peptide O-prenyltransferase [Limnofasciculus baicalensis]|uniref:LynF/TruF/PatF family peptide O-prenyltransferase n=1 Tax=Limnofasciculus baicalensis BBK-W-15 TaxID=2699891 RepID=A0AAE3KN56_9CYAN|nr:LynF/TruF/PatF family peptide O-prenyltransferase [Limnofasciculus baicalensis]MCP2729481.1 LynF/TruF/PatF family peptide O-prenyltransferase [Limnofasciculus baicalensis BBK-W-15]